MSRLRKYGEDLTYGEEHRHRLPQLYKRIGHRIDMADRDWTEFCHWCKEPLGIYEEIRDVGQNINEKATTVTRRLANMAGIPAFLFAWRVDRPAEVQREIERLNSRVRELESSYPILGFQAKQLSPVRGQVIRMTTEEWWQDILALHRDHHRVCSKANQCEKPVKAEALEECVNGSELWTPHDQLSMDKQLTGAA
jgi:hypothetical protein